MTWVEQVDVDVLTTLVAVLHVVVEVDVTLVSVRVSHFVEVLVMWVTV